MDKKITTFFLLIFYITLVKSHLKINQLNGPSSLELGTEDDLILDCIYEAEGEEGLEIKWFYNNQPIYQWIPHISDPRSLGNLSKRIDLKYKITDNEDNMYRALKIKNITLDLSGTYTCKVSSYYNEETETRELIIYEPVESMALVHIEEADTVVCEASGVFPKPVMKIYILGSNGTDIENNITSSEIFGDEDYSDDIYEETDEGYYNVTDTFLYEESSLTSPTKFVCELTIPGTNYKEVQTLIYYPHGAPTTPETEYDFDIPTNATEKIYEASFGNSIMPCWNLISTLLSTLLVICVFL